MDQVNRSLVVDHFNSSGNGDEPRVFSEVVKGCQITIFVVCCIGVLGNVLCITTLCSKALRNQATSLCLITLALADILVLVSCIFRYRVYNIFLSDAAIIEAIYTINAYITAYVEPVYWISLGMSSFIVVVVTTQRYLAICYPFATRRICSRTMTVVVLVCVMIIPVAMTMPHFFYYHVVVIDDPGLILPIHIEVPTEFGQHDPYRCVYLQFILPIFWYILPWVYLCIMNGLLLFRVRQSAKIFNNSARGGNGVRSTHGSHRHSRNLTVVLIILALTFLVLNLPKCVILFLRMIQEDIDDLTECASGSGSAEDRPTTVEEVANWIFTVLNISNSAVNFGLYCLFGERFRKEFTDRLLCKCVRKSRTIDAMSGKSTTLDMNHSVM